MSSKKQRITTTDPASTQDIPTAEEHTVEEQLARYRQEIEAQQRQLPQLGSWLEQALRGSEGHSAAEAVKLLHDALAWYRQDIVKLLGTLNSALELPAGNEELLRSQLAQVEQERNEAQAKLFALEQEHVALTHRFEAQRLALETNLTELDSARHQNLTLEDMVRKLQQERDLLRPRLTELERREADLEQQVADLEQRTTAQPGDFGRALGRAVDVIQQELTALTNPYVDYGLQELDLQTHVNIQLDNGELNIRFPGLNEVIAPQNLSQMHLRLRPIPKSQHVPSEPE